MYEPLIAQNTKPVSPQRCAHRYSTHWHTNSTCARPNSVIVPLQSEFFALEGISSLVSTIELIKENFNPKLFIEGILLTMVDKRNSLSSLVEKDVRNHFGEVVYKTTIPRNVKISEAPSHGKPAILYDVNCAGSMAYIGLAREILNKEGVMNEQR